VQISQDTLSRVLASDEHVMVFETMHEATLRHEHNRMEVYTFGANELVLPQGTTSLFLCGHLTHLEKGEVLFLITPSSAGRLQAHPFRLRKKPLLREDPLSKKLLTKLEWFDEDQLPYSTLIKKVEGAFVVGNVVLADHGYTLPAREELPAVTEQRYRPTLRSQKITYAQTYDHEQQKDAPALDALSTDPKAALPQLELEEVFCPGLSLKRWSPKRDLLKSSSVMRHFVVEESWNGLPQLRFGDMRYGREPLPGDQFTAQYRVGNGGVGNIGPAGIGHVLTQQEGILFVTNPLSACGGVDPISDAQLRMPTRLSSQEVLRKKEDYESALGRLPGVLRAHARPQWTGSWYTLFLYVQRQQNLPMDDAFRQKLLAFLAPYRPINHELQIEAPRYVPLSIRLLINANGATTRVSSLRDSLERLFSNIRLPDGTVGFFHPDNFDFGEVPLLRNLIATAERLPGVKAELLWLRRWGESLSEESVVLAADELIRVENNPNTPEHGMIQFEIAMSYER
jgi:Baseplate J-like protein